jgi:hypothetical protein
MFAGGEREEGGQRTRDQPLFFMTFNHFFFHRMVIVVNGHEASRFELDPNEWGEIRGHVNVVTKP